MAQKTRRCRLVVATLLIGACLAGCIPIPYRPGTTVNEALLSDDKAANTVLTGDCEGWLKAVAAAVKKAEPRVEYTDARSVLHDVFPDGRATLAQLTAAQHQGTTAWGPADFLLVVGWPTPQQLSDQGVATPGLFGVIGYERVKKSESLLVMLLGLQGDRTLDDLTLHTEYSDVAAGLWWGIQTEAMPENALRNRLTKEVAQRVSAGKPAGTIRLAIIGAAALKPETTSGAPEPSGTSTGMKAFRDYVHSQAPLWDADSDACLRAPEAPPSPPLAPNGEKESKASDSQG